MCVWCVSVLCWEWARGHGRVLLYPSRTPQTHTYTQTRQETNQSSIKKTNERVTQNRDGLKIKTVSISHSVFSLKALALKGSRVFVIDTDYISKNSFETLLSDEWDPNSLLQSVPSWVNTYHMQVIIVNRVGTGWRWGHLHMFQQRELYICTPYK